MTPRLAIDGGPPLRTAPLAPWPHFDDEQIRAAADVLASGRVNYWTGDQCRRFETEYAERLGIPHAIALTNGTVAIELAVEALGLNPGDEVVVTPRTFVASASSLVLRGLVPRFADVDPDSQNITPASIEAVLTPRTRAILCVHLAGWPCDMPAILDLARQRNLLVIEDCAQAHGATIDGRHVGSFGHANAFSFCQDKILTTGGEGGLLVTADQAVWRKAWAYKDHGKSWEAVYEREHPPGFRWLVESFGTNWRMTEIQGALGRIQLARLPEWTRLRTRNAETIIRALDRLDALRTPRPADGIGHAWYKLYTFVRPDALRAGWSRERIVAAIQAEGIPCSTGSCSEVYLEKAFPPDLRPPDRLPVARELGETAVMFQVHPTLSEQDIEDTAEAITRVVRAATR